MSSRKNTAALACGGVTSRVDTRIKTVENSRDGRNIPLGDFIHRVLHDADDLVGFLARHHERRRKILS
ncbi:hypothetical protein [Burkholderia metallica]|uniref:hypothetical protein n=1 Tax=Burkholderia metallica TaxID=488729 RepID=UPI001574FB8C|nr:hypothetical protein [Burkholderia metallica]